MKEKERNQLKMNGDGIFLLHLYKIHDKAVQIHFDK